MFTCTHCGQTAKKLVKGLCIACYTRQQRTGSLDYQRKGTFTLCTVDGCGKHARSHGLCGMHANRMRRHGHLEQTRPTDWGERNDHPLTVQWNYLHHKKGAQLCAPEWLTDFERFVQDVGDRPSPLHRLKRKDPNRLIGPDNFVWAAPEYARQPGETQREADNRAERGRRAENPDLFRNLHLRKKYAGLSLRDVAAMSVKQAGKCAICNEVVVPLVVDHKHDTDIIRGLLCHPCNRGLGFFRDNPERLRAAARYLENPPGEAQPRTPIRRRKPRTQLQPGTAQNDVDTTNKPA